MIISLSLVLKSLQVNKFDFGKEQKAPYSFTSLLSQFFHPTNLPFGQDAVLCHLSFACAASYVHTLYTKLCLYFVKL